MNVPAFSVVMPVYNVEDFVAQAIASVLRQTFRDFELLIVDDGGDDGSLDICRAFSDPRIRIINQPNRGLPGARNTGIAQARGRYVALLDADDLWRPEKLMMHYIHLEGSPEVDVSYAGSRIIDSAGRALAVAMRPRLTGVTPGHILMRNPVGNGSAAVMRRSALDRVGFTDPSTGRAAWFDESLRQSEDIELWVRMSAAHGCRFEGIEGLLTHYRVGGGGLSANIVRQFQTWELVVGKARAYAPDLVARYGQLARAFQLRYLARRAVQLGDGSFAGSLMRQALAASPLILLKEPRKTLETIAACLAMRLAPAAVLQRLMSPPAKA